MNTDEALLKAAVQRLIVSGSHTPTKRGEARQRAHFAISTATRTKLDELAQMTGRSRTQLIEQSVSELHRLYIILDKRTE